MRGNVLMIEFWGWHLSVLRLGCVELLVDSIQVAEIEIPSVDTPLFVSLVSQLRCFQGILVLHETAVFS